MVLKYIHLPHLELLQFPLQHNFTIFIYMILQSPTISGSLSISGSFSLNGKSGGTDQTLGVYGLVDLHQEYYAILASGG